MKQPKIGADVVDAGYDSVFREVAGLVTAARQSAARSVNAVMTAAYWWPSERILQTASEESPSQSRHQAASAILQTVSGESGDHKNVLTASASRL